MTDNKVVIKINYDKDKIKKAPPKMVNEWYLGRIVAAVVILLIIIVGLVLSVFSSDEINNQVVLEKKKPERQFAIDSSGMQVATKNPEHIVTDKITQLEEATEEKHRVINTKENINNQALDKKENIDINTTTIFDSRVGRSILAKGLKNKEPVGEISGPIEVNKRYAVGVFYFTEINNMKGQFLFHKWYRNDKLVFKRKINILGDRWRASTSKLLPYSLKGSWVVKLVDESEKVLSEVSFEVI